MSIKLVFINIHKHLFSIAKQIKDFNKREIIFVTLHPHFLLFNWQGYFERCPISSFGINTNLPSMRLHNIITQTQPQSSTLACWFGGKERLEDFVSDGVGDAGAVVGNGDLYPTPLTPLKGGMDSRNLYGRNMGLSPFRTCPDIYISGWLGGSAGTSALPGTSIEGIVQDIQQYFSYVRAD
jgi:hypothetical protein